MTTIRVSTRAQFDVALAKVKGGDTILLANGDYGDLTTSRDFTSAVTLRSENPLGANFGKITLSGATGITVEGVEVERGFDIVQNSSNISVKRVDVDGTFNLRNSSNILIEDSRVHDGQFGISINSIQNFVVRNNDVSGAREDLMRVTGNSYGGLIEGNFIHDPKPAAGVHPDCIQLFGSNSGFIETPHDITIRQNHLYALDDASGNGGAQGIFISDPRTTHAYKNLLIEENLIQVGFTNALYINGGQENVRILNNTLIPNAKDGSGMIRIADRYGFDNSGVVVDGNVAKMILDETKSSTIGDNYIYGRWANLDKLFQGGGENGGDWESFLPVKGSPIDLGSGYGAEDLLAKLSNSPIILPPAGGNDEDTQVPDIPNVVFERDDVYLTGRGANNVKVAHKEAMEVDEGSIALTFNADTTGWRRGLFSKDSSSQGDHVSAWIEGGTLKVNLQDGTNQTLLSHAGIKAHRDYDLLLTFDEANVKLWLDGKMVSQKAFDLDLSENHEALLLGANNEKSTTGTINQVRYGFDGRITDFTMFDQAITPQELEHYNSSSGLESLSIIPMS